jgi:hypothetical protein
MDLESTSSPVKDDFWLWGLERIYGVLFCLFLAFQPLDWDGSFGTATTCILDWQLDTAIPARDFRTYSTDTCV